MTEVILVVYFNANPALTPLHTEETISAYKNAEKCTILTLIFDKCSGGHSPRHATDPHTGEGLRRPSTHPIPRGHLDCQVLRAPRYVNPALV